MNFLKLAGVRVARLHSSRSQEQRLQALQDFKDGKVQVLVATDIVARGIDIDGVSHVVNFDFPVNPEDYVHRIGRTGRAEASGDAISFVPKQDLNLLDILEMFIGAKFYGQRSSFEKPSGAEPFVSAGRFRHGGRFFADQSPLPITGLSSENRRFGWVRKVLGDWPASLRKQVLKC